MSTKTTILPPLASSGPRPPPAHASTTSTTPSRTSGTLKTRRLPTQRPRDQDFAASISNEPPSVLDPPSSTNTPRHNVCLELLIAGQVNSFVEIFTVSANDPSFEDDNDKLRSLQRNLSKAELAARQHDWATVHTCYEALSNYFGGLADKKNAVYFRRKCAELIPHLKDDPVKCAQTYGSLGILLEDTLEYGEAMAVFQSMYEVTKAGGKLADIHKVSCNNLVRCYLRQADLHESSDDFSSSLVALSHALERAEEGHVGDLLSTTHYRLGRAIERLGDAKKAIKHLESYMERPTTKEEQVSACAVLGSCYEMLGDLELASEYFVRVVDMSLKAGTPRVTVDACLHLGAISLSQGKFQKALDWYSDGHRHSKQCSPALANECSLKLAMARSKVLLQGLRETMNQHNRASLASILRWKDSRISTFADPTINLHFSGEKLIQGEGRLTHSESTSLSSSSKTGHPSLSSKNPEEQNSDPQIPPETNGPSSPSKDGVEPLELASPTTNNKSAEGQPQSRRTSVSSSSPTKEHPAS